MLLIGYKKGRVLAIDTLEVLAPVVPYENHENHVIG